MCASLLVCRALKKHHRRYSVYASLLLTGTFEMALLLRFGFSVRTLEGYLLALPLLYGAFSDITDHTVADGVSILTFLIGCLSLFWQSPVSMLIGFLVVFLGLLSLALAGGKLEGADMKVAAALAWALGLVRGLSCLFLGSLAAVIFMPLLRRKQGLPRDKAFPFVPFLACAGCLLYLL